MTRAKFLINYEEQLKKRYSWASDREKLENFMQSVIDTLDGQARWSHEGEAVVSAWHSIGGKGKPTRKALRGLK